MRLDSFEPLLARLPAGTFVGATGPPIGSTDLRRFVAGVVRVSQWFVVGYLSTIPNPDLTRFVVAVARAAADNPQLLSMLRDCRAMETPSDEEVHRLVHYCLCLHLITKELAASPNPNPNPNPDPSHSPNPNPYTDPIPNPDPNPNPNRSSPPRRSSLARCWSTSATRCGRRKTGGSSSQTRP